MKSSFCGTNACVDVDMENVPGLVQVYDEHGNRCWFTHDEWIAFVQGVKNNEFDVASE